MTEGIFRYLRTHLCQHPCCLLPSHDTDLGIGPHEKEVGAVGAAAHAIVASSKAAADDDRDLWHLGG